MALDNLGVRKQAFVDLQEDAKARIFLASDSLKTFAGLLRSQSLGSKFHLAIILEELIKLGLDFRDSILQNKEAIRSAFLGRLVRDSMNHSLREVKFKARIPVPRSYQLVGVADEGRAYINEGEQPDNVFTLGEKQIYGMICLDGRVACCSAHSKDSLRTRVRRQRTRIFGRHMSHFTEPSDSSWR
jgi:RNA-dependent RNA polymerase